MGNAALRSRNRAGPSQAEIGVCEPGGPALDEHGSAAQAGIAVDTPRSVTRGEVVSHRLWLSRRERRIAS